MRKKLQTHLQKDNQSNIYRFSDFQKVIIRDLENAGYVLSTTVNRNAHRYARLSPEIISEQTMDAVEMRKVLRRVFVKVICKQESVHAYTSGDGNPDGLNRNELEWSFFSNFVINGEW